MYLICIFKVFSRQILGLPINLREGYRVHSPCAPAIIRAWFELVHMLYCATEADYTTVRALTDFFVHRTIECNKCKFHPAHICFV